MMKACLVMMSTFLLTLGLTSCISSSNVSVAPVPGNSSNSNDSDNGTDSNCPTNFIAVPANNTLGTPEFCISKFEMKASLNDGTPVFNAITSNNSGLDVTLHKAESRPEGVPWTRIGLTDAYNECANLGGDYHLSTVKEWQAVALNVESVAANWVDNTVGSGALIQGHSDGAISGTAITDGYAVSGFNLLAAGNDSDPYTGTGQTSGNQKRTYTLSNGEIIWDLSGNAKEVVDSNGSGSGVDYTGPVDSWYEVMGTELSNMLLNLSFYSGAAGGLDLNFFTPATPGLTNTTNKIGRVYIAGRSQTNRIIFRGGSFDGNNSPGLFAAEFDEIITKKAPAAGFRCVKSL